MYIFNFFKRNTDNENIIYVLDRLLQISLNGGAINKSRNVDLDLYKILNRIEVNQEIIHLGCIPIIRQSKSASVGFTSFIKKLSLYMEYDINNGFVWASTIDNVSSQNEIHKKIADHRREILKYLYDKKMMTEDEYNSESTRKIKTLND